MSDVSVIIPTYNRVQCLARALHSVVGQTREPDQVIVVDDGSTDDTETMVLAEFPGVEYVKQPNLGVSAARNTGLKLAQSHYIAFLDSDDEWLPHKLERQMQTVSGNDPVCHTEEIWIRNGVRVNQMRKHSKSGGHIYPSCLPLCVISPSSVIVHRKVFDEVGDFDEKLPACEDYDLWLRICNRFAVRFLEDPLIVKHGGHADQLSRKYWGMDRYRITALIKMLNSGHLKHEYKAATLAELAKKCRIYLQGAHKRGRTEEIRKYEEILHNYCGQADAQCCGGNDLK